MTVGSPMGDLKNAILKLNRFMNHPLTPPFGGRGANIFDYVFIKSNSSSREIDSSYESAI